MKKSMPKTGYDRQFRSADAGGWQVLVEVTASIFDAGVKKFLAG